MAPRVYKYGLRAPDIGAPLVIAQLRLAHRFRNHLTEVERARREAVRAVLADHPDLEELGAAATEAGDRHAEERARLRAERKRARRRTDRPADRARVRELAATAKAARAALREARTALRDDPAVAARLDEIGALDKAMRKALRRNYAALGLRHGTYTAVEDAASRSRSDSRTDPHFRGWRGEGSIGEQIQGGFSVDQMGDNRRAMIVPDSHRDSTRGRRAGQGARLWLRVGSHEDRSPIWAQWPMILHRPLPEGARVKRVHVTRRRSRRADDLSDPRPCALRGDPGGVWSCEITLDLPEPTWRQPRRAVAVDLGWRQRPDGLRVAVAIGEDGVRHELLLSAWSTEGLRKAAKIRASRDTYTDAMREALGRWLRDHEIPEWLARQTQTLHAWRSPARFARLARRWRERRWGGDAEGYDLLERWRYRDRHLWDYESGLRESALGDRREQYRRWSAMLADRYDVIVIERFDLRKMARLPAAESEEVAIPTPRRQRVAAAPSEIVGAIKSAASRRGTWMVAVDAVFSTRECHNCGTLCAWDAAAYVRHQCRACGAIWDQDDNACEVLCWRYRERPGEARILVGPRGNDDVPLESRWQRARRLASERDATARKPHAKVAESDGT